MGQRSEPRPSGSGSPWAIYPSNGDPFANARGSAKRIEGQQAMVESFVDYCAHVKTHFFEEKNATVDVFGDTAVVNYRFTVRFEVDAAVTDEDGQEILVFVREGGKWKVVWRTQVSLPTMSDPGLEYRHGAPHCCQIPSFWVRRPPCAFCWMARQRCSAKSEDPAPHFWSLKVSKALCCRRDTGSAGYVTSSTAGATETHT